MHLYLVCIGKTFFAFGSFWIIASASGSLVNPVRSVFAAVIFSILSIVVQIFSGTSSSGNLAIFTSLTEKIDYILPQQKIV
jgi:hypothetical protein